MYWDKNGWGIDNSFVCCWKINVACWKRVKKLKPNSENNGIPTLPNLLLSLKKCSRLWLMAVVDLQRH